MARDNVAITYSPYNRKFYSGSHDRDGVDFSRDQDMMPIAKLNPELKMGEGRIEPIHYETFRQAERDYRQGNISATSLSNITVIQLLDEVIRRQWRAYAAIHAV